MVKHTKFQHPQKFLSENVLLERFYVLKSPVTRGYLTKTIQGVTE
jgi:hypothetical protein